LIDKVLDGINTCIFAFGCTGTGKTYSMIGPEGGKTKNIKYENIGILPRVVSELFRRISRLESDTNEILGNNYSKYQVRASFLEIYCE